MAGNKTDQSEQKLEAAALESLGAAGVGSRGGTLGAGAPAALLRGRTRRGRVCAGTGRRVPGAGTAAAASPRLGRGHRAAQGYVAMKSD